MLKTLQVLEGTYLYAGGPQTVLCPYNVADVEVDEVVEVVNSKGEACCVATIKKITKKLFCHMTTADCHTVAHSGFSSWGSAYETQRKLNPDFSQISPVSLIELVPDAYIIPGVTYSVVKDAPTTEPEPIPEGADTDEYMDSVVEAIAAGGVSAE